MSGFKKPTKTLDKLWPALREGEPRAVHEARKLTRRAQAQLRIADAPKRTRRAWRELRQAVAPVRDRDAAGQHLVAALEALQVPSQEVHGFQVQWDQVRQRTLAEVDFPKRPPKIDRPRRWKARVREMLERDADALWREGEEVLVSEDVERWHEWRKGLKRYRYTLELLEDAPPPLLEVLDALGRMQDAQVMQDLLTREEWLPAYREALIALEVAAQQGAQAQVREQWPALAEHLRAQTGKEGRRSGRRETDGTTLTAPL